MKGDIISDVYWRRLGRMDSRSRVRGTRSPFCCICGEHDWRVRYDLHHLGRRKYDERVLRLCITCHNKVSDMEKDYPPIPANVEPRLARMISLTRGRIIVLKQILETDEELEQWLSGTPFLPPPAQIGEK